MNTGMPCSEEDKVCRYEYCGKSKFQCLLSLQLILKSHIEDFQHIHTGLDYRILLYNAA